MTDYLKLIKYYWKNKFNEVELDLYTAIKNYSLMKNQLLSENINKAIPTKNNLHKIIRIFLLLIN